MRIQHGADGSLAIRENFRFLRFAAVVCACAAGAIFVLVFVGEGEPAGAGWAALGVAALCLAGGVVDDRNFRFDAATRKLAWERSNLFRSRRGELPFAEIKDVVVVAQKSRDSDHRVGGYDTRYSAVLVTTAGTMPLSSHHAGSESEYRDLVAKVRKVLALPEKAPDGDDEVRRLIAAGRTIDAVSLVRERDGLDLSAAHAAVRRIAQQRDPSQR